MMAKISSGTIWPSPFVSNGRTEFCQGRGLAATFSTTGSSVKIVETLQVSADTKNDFSNPVTYTVTAGDASKVNYSVSVTTFPETDTGITANQCFEANNPATKEVLFASKEMLSWNSDTTQKHRGWNKIITSTKFIDSLRAYFSAAQATAPTARD